MGTESLYQGRFEEENRVAVSGRVIKLTGGAKPDPIRKDALQDENVGKAGPRTSLRSEQPNQGTWLPNAEYSTVTPTPPTPVLLYATDNTSIFYTVDGLTGVRTPVGPCGVASMRSLAIDPTSGILYGVTGYPDGGGPLSGRIWVVDINTGIASPAPSQIAGGACPGSGSVFDFTGQMFAMEGAGCSSGRYHAVDKTTGLSLALLATLNPSGFQGQSLVEVAGQAFYSMGTDIYPITLATGVLGPPVPLTSGPIRDMCEVGGTVYGVRIDGGPGSQMGTLCVINPTSGLVTPVGASQNWLGLAG